MLLTVAALQTPCRRVENLLCGKEFAYDLEQGRVIDPTPSQMKLLLNKATQVNAEK